MRVLSIAGTRPEILKLAPVVRALAATPGVRSLLCTTGQHRALMTPALELFGLQPDFALQLRRRSQTPDALASALLQQLGPLVARVRPDWILAVGDTTSVLCASLVAVHHRIRFAHLEAGLRTDCLWSPFPEEANRRVASVLAQLHCAPTAGARAILRRENIPSQNIVVTGNPIIDALHWVARTAAPPPSLLWRRLGLDAPGPGPHPRLIVATFHRRENHGRPLRNICGALRDLAAAGGRSLRILCVVHPNPAVNEPTRRLLARTPNLVLSAPLAYPAMIAAVKRAHLVLTDSGGLQEEAPALGVPVLILRERTERPEAVAAGAAALVGTDRAQIVAATQHLLDDPTAHRRMAAGFTGYGDGHAAARIVQALLARGAQNEPTSGLKLQPARQA